MRHVAAPDNKALLKDEDFDHMGLEAMEAQVDLIEQWPWVFDAGCGSGSLSAAVRTMGGRLNILAYDRDENMVALTKKRMAQPLADLIKEMNTETLTKEEKAELKKQNSRPAPPSDDVDLTKPSKKSKK